MLEYEMFKEVVREQIRDYLPEQFKDMDISINPVKKINIDLDGLTLTKRGQGGGISPTIYINDMFNHYKESKNLEEILTESAKLITEGFEKAKDIRLDPDDENRKENIVFQLVNTEQNKEMLSDMPHRDFQDLSIIYRWIVGFEPGGGINSAVINNSFAENMGLSEQELYNLAVENTRRILPPRVLTMQEMMRHIFTKDGMPEEMVDMLTAEMEPEQTMWLITNDRGINGAINMLYEDQLREISEKMNDDLYVLPSSVHEVIAISASMGEPEELAKMVSEINLSTVALEERLSNQVYHYDKDLRKLTMATDTPNKRLDGMVAEPPLIYEAKGQSR